MKLNTSLLQIGLLALSASSALAASWTFSDATVSVTGKGSGVGSGLKEKLLPNTPLAKEVTLSSTDTLKIILTTQDHKTAKRPSQAFLLLKDPSTNLDISYPLSVKDNGKAKVEVPYKDLPVQFQRSQTPISANLVIASFGSSTGHNAEAFKLSVVPDSSAVAAGEKEKPLRYGKLPEIHHVFGSDPKQPNVVISFVFAAAAIAALPIWLGASLFLGGNLNHLQQAMSDAPIAHALFVGSIVALEGILFMYYTSWNLFQTLPALVGVGVVSFVSGSRALTEVQERRLKGLR